MAAGESLQPDVLCDFLERHRENSPDYVAATINMIRRRYPEHVETLVPRLQRIMDDKIRAARAGRRR